jgi:toxin ParE1/3/4
MIRNVVVRQPALDDITEAVAWYETQSSGLGEELLEQIIGALERVKAKPELFRIIRREGEVRRVLTDRFPYRIFFSVANDTIYVHAVLHGARDDRLWRGRI